MNKLVSTLAIVAMTGVAITAQHVMPAGMSHEEHLKQLQKDDALKQRGAVAMGFDQDASVHHFLLQPNGGTILVSSKNPTDQELIAQIRSHFREIAGSFGEGLFDKPVATHGELPPGASAMSAEKRSITYRYEQQRDGASVVIETANAAAREAIHAFLRYQIVEHKTGDPLTIQ